MPGCRCWFVARLEESTPSQTVEPLTRAELVALALDPAISTDELLERARARGIQRHRSTLVLDQTWPVNAPSAGPREGIWRIRDVPRRANTDGKLAWQFWSIMHLSPEKFTGPFITHFETNTDEVGAAGPK